MKMMMKKLTAVLLAASTLAYAAPGTGVCAVSLAPSENATLLAAASTDAVTFVDAAGYGEGAFAEWQAVSGASAYAVYADGTRIDDMLIRQYADRFRADALGLKAGSHTLKVVPVISGKEDASKGKETQVNVTAHIREGYGWVNGTSSGAYNEDGTLRSGAAVIYVTEKTKDTVKATLPDKKGNATELTGVQNIITNLKSNTKCGPVCIRFIGNITDPANMPKGDLYVDGVTCGLTIEGIGKDATFNGFGLVLKGCSNVEVRNLGFMNCNSDEGDDVGLQQDDDHCWVHNCDMFYGDAGSDADQVKGDGALDTKKSHYITHSFNHFWDNGKCNLQGASASDTSDLITYHHNWYDHSDSRHPRVRVATVHVYNNYYDGNAKYGIGSTTDSDVFAESNYFRNCKDPMLISMQGTDYTDMVAAGNSKGTLSGETGGIIKAYGNIIEGAKSFVSYADNNTEFDAYVASSRNEQVPSSVKAKNGGATYNNFDTASDFYKYSPDKAEDVPRIVTAGAGRVQGGDFQWKFDNAVDDTSSAVNDALKSAIVNYKDSIMAIGTGFTDSTQPVTPTEPQPTDPQPTQPQPTDPQPTQPVDVPSVEYTQVIYASPNGTGSGKTEQDPTNVLDAINKVPEGGIIFLLSGTYASDKVITIADSNSGSAGKLKTMSAYPGASVKFDFSSEEYKAANGKPDGSNQRGIQLDGSYWHFYGFEVYGAADNGIYVTGKNNIVEMVVLNGNRDTGLQISRKSSDQANMADWPANNLIKNCTSFNNCDDATMENADGFAAKLTCGQGNVFDGCIAYNNSDDGWDLYAKEETGPIGVVTIRNCIAFRNGFTTDGRGYGDCDGNGFKLGGGGIGTRHIIENCLAFENLNCGFTDNNNPEFGVMKNCTAYNNNLKAQKANYMVYRCSTSATFENMMSYYNTAKVTKTNAPGIKAGNDKFVGTLTSGIYYNSKYYYAASATTMTNGAKLGDVITPADSDFIMLNVGDMTTDFHKAWRRADGSPNPGGFAETTANGTYAALGYHMVNGVTQAATPAIGLPAAQQQDPTEPQPTEPQPTEAKPTEPQPTSGELTVTLYGDANEDGLLNIMDVIAVNKSIMVGEELTPQGKLNADVDGSDPTKPDAKDSLNILKAVVKLIELPVKRA